MINQGKIFRLQDVTVDQKKVFYKSVVDGLVKAIGIRPEDVLINLIEVRKENWSFGYGIATYAA